MSEYFVIKREKCSCGSGPTEPGVARTQVSCLRCRQSGYIETKVPLVDALRDDTALQNAIFNVIFSVN